MSTAITDNRTPEIFPYGEAANAKYQVPEYGIAEELPVADALAEEESPVLLKWDSGVLKACTAVSDIPYGVFLPGSTHLDNSTLKGVCVMFGNIIQLVAGGAITEGDLVVVAANGKVQATPSAAGTYYQIGQAIESGAANDEIKIVTQPPVKVVVTA
jgi:hypothetical protein